MKDFVINNGILEKYNGSASIIEIPSGIVEIDVDAFKDNVAMLNVIIPKGVKQIQACAFKGCSHLESVSLPEGLESIGVSSFGYCKLLKNVLLPESVSFIGRSAFIGCSALEKVVIPSKVKMDSLYSISPSDGVFNQCESLKTAGPINSNCNIEFGWTNEIPAVAFLGSNLIKATLPDTIKSIGHLAFYRNVSYCFNKNHESVRAEEDLKIIMPKNCKIGRRAFPVGSQLFFLDPINSKDKIDSSVLDYIDRDFVKRLSNEEIAWILLFQTKKWRTKILSLINSEDQLVTILNCCNDILRDTKKLSKSVEEALAELQSRLQRSCLK